MNKALIVGFTGRTSYSLAKYLLSKGMQLIISDIVNNKEKQTLISELSLLGSVISCLGKQDPSLIAQYKPQVLFLSPGVPQNTALVQEALKNNISILNDIEYFAQEFPQRIFVSITGTDGKTTASTWLHHIISLQKPCVLCGNVGVPIFEFASENYSSHIHVIELSSFQLELVQKFHAKASVILNISPDHLDRYSSLDDYASAKSNVFANMDKKDLAVLNEEDPFSPLLKTKLNAMIETFSFDKKTIWHESKDVIYHHNKPFFDCRFLKVPGRHQIENAMAVSALAFFLEIDEDIIKQGLSSFEGVEHRLQYLGEKNGVYFYNDSKATSPHALQVALEAFPKKIILLAGGQSKGVPFESIKPLIENRTKAVFPFGSLSQELITVWNLASPSSANLEEAFQKAFTFAEKGDIIVLSPGGTSYDAYHNYEERGKHFQSLFQTL